MTPDSKTLEKLLSGIVTLTLIGPGLPALAEPLKPHFTDIVAARERQTKVIHAASQQDIAEEAQLDLERQQSEREFEQSQAEWRQADWEDYRVKMLQDRSRILAALQVARDLADATLIEQRLDWLEANSKELDRFDREIADAQRVAKARYADAQRAKSSARASLQTAQSHLEIIKKAELQRINELKYQQERRERDAITSEQANSNLITAPNLIHKLRNSTQRLLDLAEPLSHDTETGQIWAQRSREHSAEIKTLEAQITFLNAIFGLLTALAGVVLVMLKQPKWKTSQQFATALTTLINQIAQSYLRDDLFCDFQESTKQDAKGNPLLTALIQLIRLFEFVRGEHQIRQEDKHNPNRLQGTGGATPGEIPDQPPIDETTLMEDDAEDI
jgi:hypothetical protein